VWLGQFATAKPERWLAGCPTGPVRAISSPSAALRAGRIRQEQRSIAVMRGSRLPVGANDSTSCIRMHPVGASAAGPAPRRRHCSMHNSAATHLLRRCQPAASPCRAPGTALNSHCLRPAASGGSRDSRTCDWRSIGSQYASPARRRHQLSPCAAASAVLSRGDSDDRGGDADSRSESELPQPPEAALASGADERRSPASDADEPPRSRANTAMIALRRAPRRRQR
jgi:hypothetical protein